MIARGENDDALVVLAEVPGSFAADGLAARIRLESDPARAELRSTFVELDRGDTEQALTALIASLPGADGVRDDIRRVVVGVLDELGVDHPLARDARRRLSAALH